MTMKKNSYIDKMLNAMGLTRLRYRAVDSSDTTARPIFISHGSEDRELPPTDRAKLLSLAQDVERNFSLCGYAIRKHLQSVAYYNFYADSPDERFNERLTYLVKRWQDSCDITDRYGFADLIYIIERLRLVDGDVALLKTSDNKIQIIEGDRIRDPQTIDQGEHWVHGVKCDNVGKPIEYAVWDRNVNGGNLIYQTTISAENIDLLGYFTRADQVRGISPLAPALRMFGLLEDAINLALNKAKIEQSIGLVTRLIGDSTLAPNPIPVEQRENGIDQAARETFGKGILHLSLRDGEDAQLLSSNNPSSNFLAFCEQIIRLVLASIDVPYSFYDGSAQTFFSGRGELEAYIDSVEHKQAPTIRMLNRWISRWLLPNWILRGDIDLPAGATIDDVSQYYGWSGAGLPTWRLIEYGKDAGSAISLGLISPKELVASYGFNPRKNLEDVAEYVNLAKELGISLPYGNTTSTNIGL